jgi:hypothetical protein
MLKKEMPIFEESAVLSYRESSKVENLEYTDEGSDKKFMKMDQTIWFDPVNQDQTQTDLLASEVNIPNIAALGAWQSITTYNCVRRIFRDDVKSEQRQRCDLFAVINFRAQHVHS